MTWLIGGGIIVLLIILALVMPDTIDALTRLLWMIIAAPFRFAAFAVRALLGNRAWSGAASRFALTRRWWGTPGPGRLLGEVNGVKVEVTTQRLVVHGDRKLHTRVRIEGLPQTLALAARSSGSASGPTGDPEFDALVELQGPDALVLAAFDAETRDHVSVLISRGALRLSKGTLHYLLPHTFRSARRISDDLHRCLRVAAALTDPIPPSQRLLLGALDATPLTYRRKLWQALIANDDLDVTWFETHLERADLDGTRLLTALVHAPDVHLAALAADAEAALPLRMMAMDALDAQGLVTEALADAALRGPAVVTRRVLSLFTAHDLPVPVSRLTLGVLDAEPEVAVVVMRWIGTSSDPGVASAALHALAHEEPVQLAACDVLRFAGDRSALAPLVDVRSSANPELRKAAARAIEAIRARVGGEVGSVAVVDEKAGAVDVVGKPSA